MKPSVKAVVRRVAVITGLAALLLLAWNVPTLLTAGTPAVRAEIAAITGNPPDDPVLDGSADRIVYPRLYIDAPYTESAHTSPLDSEDWNNIRSALTQGASLNFAGASFDDSSFSYLTGHSSDTYPHPYSSVFAALGQAKPGDTFYVTGGDKIRKYVVKSTQVIEPTDLNAFSQASLTSGMGATQHIALVTCWPLFTSLRRMVVVGELVV